MATQTKPQRSENDDALRSAGLVATSIANVLQTGIRWGAGIFIAKYFVDAIAVLAGQDTSANIVVNFLGNLTVSSTVSWVAGVGGLAYGLRQRKLRGKSIERLHARIKELEEDRDPQRTSSHITSRGNTNPKDKK